MTSRKILRGAVISAAATFGAGAALAYDAAGTDYSNLVTQKWTEDSANELMSVVNSFACIIANTRGDLAQHVNGSWSALIDEVACDLADEQTRGGKQYADVLLTSSRASNDSDQEVQAFFASVSGDRYIANVTLRESATTLPPFGSWYFSFYKNRSGENGSELTLDLDGDNGFTDINQVGNNVEVNIAEKYVEGSDYGSQAAKVVLVDGSADTVKYVGVTEYDWSSNGGGSGATRIAGQANATHYFKASVDSSGAVTSSQCLSRDEQWQNNWRTRLYYAEDGSGYAAGDEVELSGGFSFEDAGGAYGHFGHWGVWQAGGTSFEPDSPSLEVTRKRDDASLTIAWGPGRVESLSEQSVTLGDGDVFKWWGQVGNDWGEYTIEWSAADSGFVVNVNGSDVVVVDADSEEWNWGMHSQALGTWVQWDGQTSINYQKRAKLDATSSFASAAATELACVDYQCPTATATVSNWVDGTYRSSDMIDSQNANSYFYTGASPSDGFMAYTLYYDTDDSGTLNEGDAAIYFNYKAQTNWSTQESTYSVYGSDSEAEYDNSNWPSFSVRLSPADSDIEYEYRTGAYEWDHGYFVTDANGDGVVVEQPIQFSYTYTAANDVNNGLTLQVNLAEGAYNPLGGSWSGSFTPTDINNLQFFLQYDGESLNGFPGIEVDGGGSDSMWLQLGNLANGTELTDSEGTKYVVKTAEAGLFFLSAGSSNCNDIAFTDVANIGLALGDVPDLSDDANYPRPSQAWADAPSPDDTACDVVHGVATCP